MLIVKRNDEVVDIFKEFDISPMDINMEDIDEFVE